MTKPIEAVNNFLKSLGPAVAAYTRLDVAAVVLKDPEPTIIRATLELHALPFAPTPNIEFESKHIWAARQTVQFDSPPELLARLAEGSRLPELRNARLGPTNSGSIDAHFWPLPWQRATGPRILDLAFFGRSIHQMLHYSPDLDAELQGEKTPFESLSDLYDELGFLPDNDDRSRIEVRAMPVATIDARSSITKGVATISLNVSPSADLGCIRLGWKLVHDDQTLGRDSRDGPALAVANVEGVKLARLTQRIPEGAAMQCWLTYGGCLQQGFTVNDDANVLNSRRIAHAAIDAECEWLEKFLFDKKSQQSDLGFEKGVAHLFHLLGFHTQHLQKPLHNGPDILAHASNGDILVIECSTDLKPVSVADKLSTLSERTESIKGALAKAKHVDAVVTPVFVVGLHTAEVRLDPSASDGIAVVTLDDVRRYFDATLYRSDSHHDVFADIVAKARPAARLLGTS
jgi:hypothetical protein